MRERLVAEPGKVERPTADSTKPQLFLTKGLDETSIRQFYEKLIGRELSPDEMAELHQECERAGLPPASL
ncbi:hypothetical protein [Methylocystis sp.]|uniref:hypothetical protein n=1 Tax=Methylocystis sp. TaxID=1911079 RepID=UPI0025D274ED|nr:hypothetical protein [Methylocystis sp.]